jgi:hypothetical protein
VVNVYPYLKVRVVLDQNNSSWIIEKMARRLAELAPSFGIEIDLADEADDSADVNHWMSYVFANVKHATPATMLITHVDDPYKLNLIKDELKNGVNSGICLSSHTRDDLIAAGITSESVTFVVPGHDFGPQARRIRIGLTTRLYPDGRKRESMLVNLASIMRLDPFHFDIFGKGWERVVSVLEQAGATVNYRPGSSNYTADYQDMLAAVSNFDYYLYLGRDEGSLGTLDALAAGVKTIVTPQGFHVDLPNGITHSIWSDADLREVFEKIARERQLLIDAVAGFSWSKYAEAHSIIWRAVAAGEQHSIESSLDDFRGMACNSTIRPVAHGEKAWIKRLRYFSPYRIRSAISHIPAIKPLRKWIDSKRR